MKADQTPEEIWISIVTCLQAAHKANMIMSLRSRMNPHHPQDQQDRQIANAEQYSRANWFLAKHVYFQHKDAMDSLYKAKEVYNSANDQVLIFKAMVKVCEDEVSQQFEQQILKEDSMERDNDEEMEFEVEIEELDEDELYVKETSHTPNEDDRDIEYDSNGHEEYVDDFSNDEE